MKLLPVLAATLLLGCASRPYAILDGGGVHAVNPNQHGVSIVGVDGELFPEGRRDHVVTPGVHYFQLASERRDERGRTARVPFVIEVQPCVRYRIAAEHPDSMSMRWQVKVLAEEPIAGCTLPAGTSAGDEPRPAPATPPPAQ